MAIREISDLWREGTLLPRTEQARIQSVRDNRDLYNGVFVKLGIPVVFNRRTQTNSQTKINVFRLATDLIAETLLADRPAVVIANNERLANLLENGLAEAFLDVMQPANVDLLRYGRGVIASSPSDPLAFTRFQPDQHYIVVDINGTPHTDVLIRIRQTGADDGDDEIDMFVYPFGDASPYEAEWRVYGYTVDHIGELLRTVPVPQRAGRQVIELVLNPDAKSMFDDMREPVAEIARAATMTGSAVISNLRPHMYGPPLLGGMAGRGGRVSSGFQTDDRGAVDGDSKQPSDANARRRVYRIVFRVGGGGFTPGVRSVRSTVRRGLNGFTEPCVKRRSPPPDSTRRCSILRSRAAL